MTCNGATGWGFIGEISSQRLRPYTAGFAAASTCVAGVVMDVLTPYMVNSTEWDWELKTGWFYAGIGLPMVIGMWLIIPETANRSAAELDELYERKIKPCKCSPLFLWPEFKLMLDVQGDSARRKLLRKAWLRSAKSSSQRLQPERLPMVYTVEGSQRLRG